MSVWQKIRGTVETLFQFGKGGQQIKSSGTALETRTATDSAYAIHRGADPVGANDLVTLGYFNANNASGNQQTVVKMPLAQATKVSSTSIPDNAIIFWCTITVTTAYNGTTPTFKITRTGDSTVILEDTGDSDLTALGGWMVPQQQSWGSTGAGTVTATFAGTGVSTGASTLYIAYSTPTDIS